jgi:transcriptional regulator with XRE-family HTH domain
LSSALWPAGLRGDWLGGLMSTPSRPYRAFGETLWFLRRKSGWTQEELADRSGLHTTEISRLESGRRNPTLKTMKRLAGALEVPRWHIMALEERLDLGLASLPAAEDRNPR